MKPRTAATAALSPLFGTILVNLLLVSLSSASSFSPSTQPQQQQQSSAKLRVAVIGGTHGNEYTGVWCIKALEFQRQALKEKYPSLEITTILANPKAFMANRRFIDTDLNREFNHEKLCSVDDIPDDTVEGSRAQELNSILGSKCSSDEPNEFDVAIDLHSTTSNMGTTLIINEGDALMAQGAAYVMAKACPNANAKCLMHSIPEKGRRPNVSSTTTHGFTIEVGPVPQGLVRHDAVLKTECALHGLLEFLQRRQEHVASMSGSSTSSSSSEAKVNGDGDVVLAELHKAFASGTVPAFRTAPAQRPGEMSGKIAWPSDVDNPNFPQYMIHESMQDNDYQLLRKGDPIFVALDGSIIPYDGAYGDQVYIMFVNEAGYYYPSSGTGISVAVQARFHLDTGLIVPTDHATATAATKSAAKQSPSSPRSQKAHSTEL